MKEIYVPDMYNNLTTAQVRVWLWISVGLWYVSWLSVLKTTIQPHRCVYGCGRLLVCGMFYGCQS